MRYGYDEYRTFLRHQRMKLGVFQCGSECSFRRGLASWIGGEWGQGVGTYRLLRGTLRAVPGMQFLLIIKSSLLSAT